MGMNLDFGSGNNDFGFNPQRGGDLRGGAHLLEALLGRSPALQQSFARLNRDAQLRALSDSYARFSRMSPSELAGLMRQGGISPRGFMPRPNMSSCICPNRYTQPQSFDLRGNGPIESFLRNNPFERQQIEMAIGGRIVSADNGRLAVQPFPQGAFPSAGQDNNHAYAAQALMGMMQRAAGDQMMQNAFQGMVLNGMAQLARGQNDPNGMAAWRANGGSMVDWTQDSPEMARRRNTAGMGQGNAGMAQAMSAMFGPNGGTPGDFMAAMNAMNAMGGMGPGGVGGMGYQAQGIGGYNGGINNAGGFNNGGVGGFNNGGVGGFNNGGLGGFNNGGLGGANGGYGAQAANSYNPDPYGGDTNAIMNDGALTVEDKITLMIMMIMKQMDKQIEAQAQYINQLQQQANGGGGGGGGKGGGGKGGGGGGGGAPSIDVETMKLKRLIDKRSQMFDMLRQIIDKYNQTAKGIIDSIGR